MKLHICILILLFPVFGYSQNLKEHYKFNNEGDSLVRVNKINDATYSYKKALKYFDNDYLTHQSLAAIYLRLNKNKKADYHLRLAISNGIELGLLKNDTTIKKYFKENLAWSAYYKEINQKFLSKIPYQEERITLIKLLEKDQTLRGLLGKLDFKKVDSLIHENDISNMASINKIIDRIGFPDKVKVGVDGSNSLFILLMHTLNNGVDQKINSEKIFPLIEKSVKEGNFPPFYYAILVDRQRGLRNEKQVFGTYWENKENKRIITPIENIESVDRRRFGIGLPRLKYSSELSNLILPKDYIN